LSVANELLMKHNYAYYNMGISCLTKKAVAKTDDME